VLLGKAERYVGHPLLIAPLIHFQAAGILLQRLAQPQHVAMAEDGEYAVHKFVLGPIHLHVLLIEKLHQRLRHRHSDPLHRDSLLSVSRTPPWIKDPFSRDRHER